LGLVQGLSLGSCGSARLSPKKQMEAISMRDPPLVGRKLELGTLRGGRQGPGHADPQLTSLVEKEPELLCVRKLLPPVGGP